MNGVWKQAALACLCAMLAVWWWTQRYGENPSVQSEGNRPTLTVQQATTYRFAENGALQDTLQAQSVSYYHDSRETRFIRPTLRREIESGHLHGESQEGHMLANGNIDFRGSVLMQRFTGEQEDMAVRSNSLHYDSTAQTLASTEEVEITSPESRTLSLGAVWQLEHNYLILQENVRSHYEPSHRR